MTKPEKPPRRKGKPLDPSMLAIAIWLLNELRGDAMLLRARIDDILAALNTKGEE